MLPPVIVEAEKEYKMQESLDSRRRAKGTQLFDPLERVSGIQMLVSMPVLVWQFHQSLNEKTTSFQASSSMLGIAQEIHRWRG